jgi:hypothetical protein
LPGRRPARNHGGQLLEHLRPAELGPAKRLFAERLRDVEAAVFEEDARPLTVRLELKAHPRVLDGAAGRPRECEPAARGRAGRLALQHLAAHGQPLEVHLGITRHAEREPMSDARLEVVGKHPLGQHRAVGDRSPDLLARLRDQDLPSDGVGHPFSPFASSC